MAGKMKSAVYTVDCPWECQHKDSTDFSNCQYRLVECPYQTHKVSIPLISLVNHSKEEHLANFIEPPFPRLIKHTQDKTDILPFSYQGRACFLHISKQQEMWNFHVKLSATRNECNFFRVTITVFMFGEGENSLWAQTMFRNPPVSIDETDQKTIGQHCLQVRDSKIRKISQSHYCGENLELFFAISVKVTEIGVPYASS